MNARFLFQSALTNTVALNQLAAVQVVQPAPIAVIAASKQVTVVQPSLVAIATEKRSRVMPTLEPAVTARLEQVRWMNPKLGISPGDLHPAVEADSVLRSPTRFSNFLFDVSSIKVLPDREASWNAILRPDSPASYQRLIHVKVRKAVFGDRITDISIDFKLGSTIDISYEEFGEHGSDQLTIRAAIFSPISNLILRIAESRLYEFRTTVLLKDGCNVQDPPNQWRTDIAETLLLTTDELPPLPPG